MTISQRIHSINQLIEILGGVKLSGIFKMVNIKNASEEDIKNYIDCYTRIWKAFRGILPDRYIKEVLKESVQLSFLENIREAISNPNRIILVAEKDGEIVGLAQGRVHRRGYSWLGFMGVSPDFRRQGIGRALLNRFIDESRRSDCTKVSLNTAPCLKPAIKLYADVGFIPEGYMRNHMHGLDLIFYSLFLE